MNGLGLMGECMVAPVTYYKHQLKMMGTLEGAVVLGQVMGQRMYFKREFNISIYQVHGATGIDVKTIRKAFKQIVKLGFAVLVNENIWQIDIDKYAVAALEATNRPVEEEAA